MAENIPRILIADDEEEIRQLVKTKLLSMKCEVLVARDGEEALSLALVEKPDLILLDVRMPGLNGWEVTKHLRKKPEFDQTAIILVTGIGEALNAATAPLYGADEYIDKPFQLAELEFKIRKVLSEKRRAKSSG